MLVKGAHALAVTVSRQPTDAITPRCGSAKVQRRYNPQSQAGGKSLLLVANDHPSQPQTRKPIMGGRSIFYIIGVVVVVVVILKLLGLF